ncbi:hypothetical protein [Streptomyces sp. 2P-4]|uniref:hypothetical protein n=1 Tax=Streptomyces sp. 2P-4 TaxID=2931974 RepID=UPI002541348D|nr:hypothetical protein [Streptomyces sp. 2P-4]
MALVTPADVIARDHLPGGHSLDGLAMPPPVPVPSRRSLLGGAQLVVPPPEGVRIDGPEVLRRAAAELAGLLGVGFGPDPVASMALYDGLVSPELRERFSAPGFALRWDRPREGFAWLAVRLGAWQVQACGEPGVLSCVSFHRPWEGQEQAAGLRALLAEAAPALDTTGLRDVTRAYAHGVFDEAWSAPELRLRCGFRQTLRRDGSAAGPAYVLRVDAGPGCREWPGP